MNETWYFLDANNNKSNDDYWVCQRCFKNMIPAKQGQSFYPIIMHPTNPWFRRARPLEKADGFIGSDCFEIVKNKYGIQ